MGRIWEADHRGDRGVHGELDEEQEIQSMMGHRCEVVSFILEVKQ